MVTAPGTELALGEKAVGDAESGAVGLALTGIDTGTTEGLNSWEHYYPRSRPV